MLKVSPLIRTFQVSQFADTTREEVTVQQTDVPTRLTELWNRGVTHVEKALHPVRLNSITGYNAFFLDFGITFAC